MSNKHLFLAAAAIAITGTAGMASWLALDSGDLRGRAVVAHPAPLAASAAATGVLETEAAVLPSPPSLATKPAERAEPVEQPARAARPARVAPPKTIPAPEWQPPAPAQPAPPPPPPRQAAEAEEPRSPVFEELTIPANAVLGVRLSTSVSSETAQIEDRVDASVTRDVIADGQVAVPAGTRLLGSVNDVTRGGTFREKARLSIRFHTLVLADGTHAPVRVDAIVREGDSPARDSVTKVGVGAAGGAIIGGVMGGRKGALLGGLAGAGAGATAAATGERSIAALTAGSPLSVRLTAPATVMIERHP